MARNTKRRAKSTPRRVATTRPASPQMASPSQPGQTTLDFSSRSRPIDKRAIEPDLNPGIPIAQVPHFVGDLARLGVVIALMVALLIAGAQLIPLLTRA
ncbi:MAG: hypothetical protein ACREP9_03380 [Candidatus Dormibacteraceae bacterium]